MSDDSSLGVTAVVVLAAGGGTRMRSKRSKLLHEVCGRSLISYAITAASALEPEHPVVVVGHQREQVSGPVPAHRPGAVQAGPETRRGTGHAQADRSIFGPSTFGHPFFLTQIIGFGIFLAAAQAELTQTPFDMPVAESELVAGYMTEYSGFRFLFFFMAEFGTAFALSAIAATLGLVACYQPFFQTGLLADVLGPVFLAVNLLLLAFLLFWLRVTFPHFR